VSEDDGQLERWGVRQGQVVDVDEGRMGRDRSVGGGHFWRGKVESNAIPAGLEMHQSFEVRIVDGPASRREPALVVVNHKGAVQRFARAFANLSEHKQDLLMYLVAVSSDQSSQDVQRTQELSVMERTRGARSEDLFMELWEPLETVEDKPCINVSVMVLNKCLSYAHSCYSA
jgi:hypothetical protein